MLGGLSNGFLKRQNSRAEVSQTDFAKETKVVRCSSRAPRGAHLRARGKQQRSLPRFGAGPSARVSLSRKTLSPDSIQLPRETPERRRNHVAPGNSSSQWARALERFRAQSTTVVSFGDLFFAVGSSTRALLCAVDGRRKLCVPAARLATCVRGTLRGDWSSPWARAGHMRAVSRRGRASRVLVHCATRREDLSLYFSLAPRDRRTRCIVLEMNQV